jgi:hypothetical protein
MLRGWKPSDRFNLETLTGPSAKLYSDRSQIAVKRLRRKYGHLGITFTVLRGSGHACHYATAREVDALGPALASVVDADYLRYCPGWAKV